MASNDRTCDMGTIITRFLDPNEFMPETLAAATTRHIPALLLIALFSVFVNLLMLTGPLFMLQVYDRVLASRSEPTLVALLILIVGLFAAMGLLEAVRGRIGTRIGATFQADLDARVFRAAMNAPQSVAKEAGTALYDLEAVRRFAGSPLAFAFFDLPFAPLFFGAIFILHPLLGWLAIGGGVLLVIIMLLNQVFSRKPTEVAGRTSAAATRISEQIRTQSDTVRGLGMSGAAIVRWRRDRDTALTSEIALSDRNGGFGSTTKILRLFLQSAMLALGAWLVIRNEVTGGAMIASSILMGRALAPVEQLVSGWANVARAAKGWSSLRVLLDTVPLPVPRISLQRPDGRLTITDLAIVPPGDTKPTLQRMTFSVEGGQALGVVGESASGKSSLARALVGLWRPAAGEVRLGGARLDQYDEDALANHVGYLPQDVVLFDGTIAQNIARLAETPDADAVIVAAKLAGAHDIILSLPKGYDTPIGSTGARLSGGQKQRIGLARALFGDPVLVVLDEPNSNLDAPGSEAINAAIRDLKSRGSVVVIMAHRPAAITECDLILMIKAGQNVAFGLRDEILRKIATNHAQLNPTAMRSAGVVATIGGGTSA
jgi:ATP-binding cassette, subfamily C, bacterial